MKTWNKRDKAWRVRITPKGIPTLKGQRIYLGQFKKREDAKLAYELASSVYHR